MAKQQWACSHKDCRHTVTTYVPVLEAPTHTHEHTKRTYKMKEVKR